jgi:hypothetical protein
MNCMSCDENHTILGIQHFLLCMRYKNKYSEITYKFIEQEAHTDELRQNMLHYFHLGEWFLTLKYSSRFLSYHS